jgi:hypothetical protein
MQCGYFNLNSFYAKATNESYLGVSILLLLGFAKLKYNKPFNL